MRHPSMATAFEWDDNNEPKLASRNVYPEDVEDVFENEPIFRKNKRSGTARWLMLGQTAGADSSASASSGLTRTPVFCAR